ncbi:MAG: helix-turn-helix domain-containing protein [Deferribacteres bacterium]|nr:helix-turn-helix domain-containing protein [candidate division KSB1 bacterium]MCB9501394.1 helix-turn-helix domain-containing protein [Deferribacteres bacterium]
MKDKFLKLETVAEMLDVSIWTVRKWVKQRRIRTYRFGRAVRIRESDLMRFADVMPSSKELRDELSL